MPHSRLYNQRRAQGVCVDCGGAVVPGFVRCEQCLENKRLKATLYRQKRKRELAQRNLQETIKAATEAGLSYGQYVAQNSEGMKWKIGLKKS